MNIYYVAHKLYDDDQLLENVDLFLTRAAAEADCYRRETQAKKSWLATHEANRNKYEVEELARKALDEAGISWANTSLRYSSKWKTEEFKPMYEVRSIEVAE